MMFRPITFRYVSLCHNCGGSIQPKTQGERDRGRGLNHCNRCTAHRALEKQARVLRSLKVA